MIRCAHATFGDALGQADPVPVSSPSSLWSVRDINPAGVDDDKTTFYERVNATVVAESLNNTLTAKAMENLLRNKHLFTFVDANGLLHQHGPTMLWLVDPATSVSIENHRLDIECATLQQFNNDVPEMVNFLKNHYKSIIENGGTYEKSSLRRHAIRALGSGPNAAFNGFVNGIKTDIKSEIGTHAKITSKQLFQASEQFYNNLVSKKEWDKVDPKDARLIALTTEIEKLKKDPSNQRSPPNNNTWGGGRGGGDRVGTVERWRTKNIGDTTVRDGVTYHWCPHHVDKEGRWNGLYYKDYKPDEHDEWKQRRISHFNSRKKKNDGGGADGADSKKKKLTLSNELKTAFASNLCVSEEDIDKIVDKANMKQEN